MPGRESTGTPDSGSVVEDVGDPSEGTEVESGERVGPDGCPLSACDVGSETCDMQGRVRLCVDDGDGCGELGEAIECEGDLTCYAGECSDGPEVLPPEGYDPDEETIVDQGVGTVPASSHPIVIPASAFDAAVSGRDFRRPNSETIQEAVQLNTEANHIATLGITAEIQQAETFSGSLFIVVEDSSYTELTYGRGLEADATPVDPFEVVAGEIQSDDYFVAAVELSGRTSWKARGANFVMASETSIATDGGQAPVDCCSKGSDSDTACGGPPGRPRCPMDEFGPERPGVCPVMLRPEQYTADPSERPFQVGDGGRVIEEPSARGGYTWLKGNGRKAAELYLYPDRRTLVSLAPSTTASAEALTVGRREIQAMVGGQACEFCKRVSCPNPDIGGGTGDGSSHSPTPAGCGAFGRSGRIPEFCTQISGRPGEIPAACGGVCGDCYDAAGGACRLGGKAGVGRVLSSISPGPSEPSEIGACPGISGVPDFCKRVDPSDRSSVCACDAQCQNERAEAMARLLGCRRFGKDTTGPNVRCVDGGYCRTAPLNQNEDVEFCYTCNSHGDCSSAKTKDNAERVSGGGVERPTEEEQDSCDWWSTICIKFGPSSDKSGGGEQYGSDEGRGTKDRGNTDQQTEAAAAKTRSTHDYQSLKTDHETQTGKASHRDDRAEVQKNGNDASEPNVSPEVSANSEDSTDEHGGTSGSDSDAVDGADGKGELARKRLKHLHNIAEINSLKPARADRDTTVDAEGINDGDETTKSADPVRLSNGAFTLKQTDLSFPGPVRTLRFRRYYDSRSDERSVLGSNWSHNFSTRVIAIDSANAPGWAPEYCTDWQPQTTCLLLDGGDGTERIFMRDPGSARFDTSGVVFVPQAGSTDTIVMLPGEGGWVLRRADGHILRFDEHGNLREDRDRFGNGFRIEYEPTPLFAAWMRYCYESEKNTFPDYDSWDPRLCTVLGVIFDERNAPQLSVYGWRPPSNLRLPPGVGGNDGFDFGRPDTDGLGNDDNDNVSVDDIDIGWGFDPKPIPRVPLSGTANHVGGPFWMPRDPFPSPKVYEKETWMDDVEMTGAEYRSAIRNARTYLNALRDAGPLSESVTGNRRFRPVKVTDDLGRTLRFRYRDNAEAQTFGLLSEVRGPAGTTVEYSYSRPRVQFPDRLNEMFLTRVKRTDSPGVDYPATTSGPDRTIDFDYQWYSHGALDSWPSAFGGRRLSDVEVDCSSFDGLSLRAKFGCYFNQITDCSWTSEIACGLTRHAAGGNPCFLSALKNQEYVSTLADNIVRVTRNHTTVESETSYVTSPDDSNFDRVDKQRYGGGLNHQKQSSARKSPYAKWQTNYPEFQLEYASAQRADDQGKDPTDLLLPNAIKRAYRKEPLAAGSDGKLAEDLASNACEESRHFQIPDHAGRVVGTSPACQWRAERNWPWKNSPLNKYQVLDHSEDEGELDQCSRVGACLLKEKLPGWTPKWDYYDVDLNTWGDGQPKIVRSRLTCAQLAARQMRDPAHNDNLTRRTGKQGSSQGTEFLEYLTGNRDEIRQNLHRICRWAKVTDRDGDTRYIGLNYKGQTLVRAAQADDGNGFIFTERAYNADGKVVEKRRPTRGVAWNPLLGATYYEYDEVQPDREYGTYLPVFWSRRANLLEVRRDPGIRSVGDYEWNRNGPGRGAGLTRKKVGSRVTRFLYEPLFNQVRKVRRGTRYGSPSADISWHSTVYYDYDYQEMTLTDPGMREFLRFLGNFGADWEMTGPNDSQFQTTVVARDQLRVGFYGQDLNFDRYRGFEHHITDAAGAEDAAMNRVKGLPVRIVHVDESSDRALRYFFDYAPNGQPNMIVAPGGRAKTLEYYSEERARNGNPGVYGRPRQDNRSLISPEFKGFLGRVTVDVLGDGLKLDSEPSVGCKQLAGPYQYLVGDCPNGPERALKKSGIAKPVRRAILRASSESGSPRELTRTFSYTRTGHRRSVSRDGRVKEYLERDPDGRVGKVVTADGNIKSIHRNADGWPVKEVTSAPDGSLVRSVRRQFDAEGRIITRCVLASRTASSTCESLLGGAAVPLEAPRPVGSGSPDLLLTTYRYTDGGQLRAVVDSAGTKTTYSYNPRKQLAERRVHHPTDSAQDRVERYEYDLDGRLVKVRRGTRNTRQKDGALGARYEYDGFGRIVSYRDSRNTQWQFAWTAGEDRVGLKQSASPYRQTTAKAKWEILQKFDGFGRLVGRNDHGLVDTTIRNTVAGRPYMIRKDGEGTRWLLYDRLGNPVWSKSSGGVQTVSVFDPGRRTEFRATTRKSNFREAGQTVRRTTSRRIRKDKRLRDVAVDTWGHLGERRHISIRRNASGDPIERVVERIDDGNPSTWEKKTEHGYNLVGWPLRTISWRSDDPRDFDGTDFTYNGRGQPTAVRDPSGQASHFSYDAFGQVRSKRFPQDRIGRPRVRLRYDGYGRLADRWLKRTANQTDHLSYDYDPQTGDPKAVKWKNGPRRDMTVVKRQYDRLGRLVRTVDYNVRPASGPPFRNPVTRNIQYDPLGRIVRESVEIHGAGANSVTRSYLTTNEYSLWNGGGSWKRRLTYPSGTKWDQRMRGDGRLEFADRATGNSPAVVTFDWVGDLYAGRSQDWSARAGRDPINQELELDGLGRPVQWDYSALNLSGGSPVNQGWADSYCGETSRNGACSGTLLEIDAQRDVMGRIRSLSWDFEHPQAAKPDRTPWRGYHYNRRGQLTGVWELAGVGSTLDTTGIPNHRAGAVDVDTAANSYNEQALPGESAQLWDFEREPNVGGLTAVRNRRSGKARWESTTARPSGHRLDTLRVDGQNRQVGHDAFGRVTSQQRGNSNDDRNYEYDERGRLTAVTDGNGRVIESYLYDASGRLVSTTDADGQTTDIAWDGWQMIELTDPADGSVLQAAWGSLQDQLLELRKLELSTGAGTPSLVETDRWVPLADHRNSTTALWDAHDEQLSKIVEYSTHGELTLRDPSESVLCDETGGSTLCSLEDMPFLFAGQFRSEETGLTYMRHRWYSPELRQFLSPDPAGYVDSYNPYAYVAFDPINAWDPYGLSKQGFAERIFGGIHERLDNATTGIGNYIESLQEQTIGNGWWGALGFTGLEVLKSFVPTSATDLYTEAVLGIATGGTGKLLKEAGSLLKKLGKGDGVVKKLENVGSSGSAANKRGRNVADDLDGPGGRNRSGHGQADSVGSKNRRADADCTGSNCPVPGKVCFVADTPVLLCDGTTEDIEAIEIGDRVWSRDEETGEFGCRTVVGTKVTPDSRVLDLEVERAEGSTETFGVTDEHPFWVRDRGWVAAGDLEPGDEVFTSRGGWVRVSGASWRAERQTVYNFEVKGFHTYFVGLEKVWVHNDCWLGKNVRETGTVSSGSLRGYRKATSDIDGGMGAARDSFESLTGRVPEVTDSSALRPTDSYVEAGKIEVYFRPNSSSGTPAIEIIDHGTKSYEKIHFN